MHQPWYCAPGSHQALLPWVRLRATKDYTDMARFIEQTEAAVTVNFTPSLVAQLKRYAQGALWDAYTPSRATSQALEEIRTGIIPMPLARRGFPWSNVHTLRTQTERNLWGWFLLAWTAQTVLDGDLRWHVGPDHAFTAEEVSQLEALHQRLVAQLVDRYRQLAHDGLVELSATPFYHPILPLLIDSAVARRPHPEDAVPVFAFAEDAHEQVQRALAHHEQTWGMRPQGMWPAEGAVSPEAAAVFAGHRVQWIATDGEILARTLGHPPTPEELYRPWKLTTPGGALVILFRDTFLSNRISFDYHAWSPGDAVADLVERIRAVGTSWKAAAPPIVLIAMDGENAWDFYERNGQPFLVELYRRIQRTPGLRLTTMARYLQRYEPDRVLPGLWSGSWIHADFRTWIGYPKQNRAWELLAQARAAVAAHSDPHHQHKALEYLYVAEGSDWFWWLSPYHVTPQGPIFDQLFRAQLAQAYRELGQEPPAELATPLH